MELFNINNYYAILLDIGLPDMSGLEVCKLMRVMQQERKSITPILALTTQVDRKTKKECLAAGMISVLPKPVRSSQLKEVLDKCRVTN
jgi:CheY-like chemotaxis protein